MQNNDRKKYIAVVLCSLILIASPIGFGLGSNGVLAASAKTNPIGSLWRSPDHKIFVVTAADTIKYIPDLKTLRSYHGRTIKNTDYQTLAKYKQVMGINGYLIGSLLRTSDHKIYILTSSDIVKYIPDLKSLRAYSGSFIHNISDQVLAQYKQVLGIKINNPAYGNPTPTGNPGIIGSSSPYHIPTVINPIYHHSGSGSSSSGSGSSGSGSSGSSADTQAPTIAITGPLTGATISSSTTITASASDNVGVTGVQFIVDKTNLGSAIALPPYQIVLNTLALANGTHTLSARATDAAGNIATSTITVTVANAATTDTQAPKITITSPLAGATISSSTTITASSSDNVGVTGVQFIVDKTNFGSVVTLPPYQIVLNTLTLTSGAHTLAARATDAAGNVATSTISVTIANATTSAVNLILNPQLSMALSNSQPANWNQGSYGNNNAQFIYPFNSVIGSTSAEILFSSPTSSTTPISGDAKWYFDNVTVQPGSSYLFSDSYESNVSTQLVAAFTLSGTTTPIYQTLVTLPPTNGAKGNSSQQITIPVGAISVTVYHIIYSVGHLTVGNFSLVVHPNINVFSAGAVSLTFDDAWASQYDNALPILNASGQKVTFFPISQIASGTVETNLVNNGSMEIDGGNGTALGWNKTSSGSSTVLFTYPAVGTDPITGGDVGKASQISISNYVSGDAKWYFDDVLVASGTTYRFRDNYKSTAPSTITVKFTVASSTNPAATSTQFKIYPALPSTNNSWQTAEGLFTTPLGVISITVFHSLNSNGDLTIDNASVSEYLDYMTKQQVLALQAAGNEIGDHTRTHPSLIALSVASATDEIVGAKNDLLALGVTQVNTMAYPYGDHNATIDAIAKSAGLIAGRGVETGYNDKATDKFSLFTQNMTSSTPFTVVKTWIDTAVQQKVWLIIVFHQIDTLGETYSTTPTILQQISDYLKTNNILTARLEDMIPLMNP